MTLEKLEKEPENLINSFCTYLKQEKGLSEETASEHAHRITFFVLADLNRTLNSTRKAIPGTKTSEAGLWTNRMRKR
jgi:hypothetical protein